MNHKRENEDKGRENRKGRKGTRERQRNQGRGQEREGREEDRNQDRGRERDYKRKGGMERRGNNIETGVPTFHSLMATRELKVNANYQRSVRFQMRHRE